MGMMKPLVFFVFFFQAEDGIRDVAVTGVQTCALPICFFHLQNHRRKILLCSFVRLPRIDLKSSARCGHSRPNGSREIENQRSEEHTSELQSRLHLVCRLLLEKKKYDMALQSAADTETAVLSRALRRH